MAIAAGGISTVSNPKAQNDVPGGVDSSDSVVNRLLACIGILNVGKYRYLMTETARFAQKSFYTQERMPKGQVDDWSMD